MGWSGLAFDQMADARARTETGLGRGGFKELSWQGGGRTLLPLEGKCRHGEELRDSVSIIVTHDSVARRSLAGAKRGGGKEKVWLEPGHRVLYHKKGGSSSYS